MKTPPREDAGPGDPCEEPLAVSYVFSMAYAKLSVIPHAWSPTIPTFHLFLNGYCGYLLMMRRVEGGREWRSGNFPELRAL